MRVLSNQPARIEIEGEITSGPLGWGNYAGALERAVTKLSANPDTAWVGQLYNDPSLDQAQWSLVPGNMRIGTNVENA